MPSQEIIAPIIHMNGDTAETLKNQLLAIYSSLGNVRKALRDGAPNARNYYPEEGLFQKAVSQHRSRFVAIETMRADIIQELQMIQAQEHK